MPDRIAALVAALGLPDGEDEVRSLLIQHSADHTAANLAIGVVCLLMLRSSVARSTVAVVARDLMRCREESLTDANVVLLDGVFLFVPGDPDGVFYTLPDLRAVDHRTIRQPLVTTVFSVGQALRMSKEVVAREEHVSVLPE